MIIVTKDLSKRFGSTVALDGVSCGIGEGATGLLGPNGAGKTTLLRILLGLLPARGSASVLGVDPMRRPREVRARLGYMPESECIIPGLIGVDVVSFMGRLAGMPRRAAFKRAHQVLYYVGLGDARYRDATEYSVGMQQRLKLATALVHDPSLLFLDEPTNGLDPKGRDEMLTLIQELSTTHGKSVILSSHLLPDVEQVCGSVIMLRAGAVAREGTIGELTGKIGGAYRVRIAGDEARFRERLDSASVAEKNGELVVRLRPGADATVIFEAAVAAGVQVRGLHPVRRSLEDVFLDAVESDAVESGAVESDPAESDDGG